MAYAVLTVLLIFALIALAVQSFSHKSAEKRNAARVEERESELAKKERLLEERDSRLTKWEEELIRYDEEFEGTKTVCERWEASLRRKERILERWGNMLRLKEKKLRQPGVDSPSETLGGHGDSESPYPDFESLSNKAALMKEYYQWRIRANKKTLTPEEKEEKAGLDNRGERLSVDFSFAPRTVSDKNLQVAAECYGGLETSSRLLAACLDGKLLLPRNQTDSDQLKTLANLCGNAFCLIRTFNRNMGLGLYDDPVCNAAYYELKKSANQNNIFITDLKRDSEGDLKTLGDLLARLSGLEKSLTPQNVERKKEPVHARIQAALAKITGPSQETPEDWNELIGGITELIQKFRVSVKSPEIGRYLIPVLNAIPEEIEKPEPFLRAVQYLAFGPEPSDNKFHVAYSDDVNKVRDVFGGVRAVFVGGTPKPHIRKRFERAFKLEEFIWEEWSHGDSLDRFRSYLNDETVRLFLIFIPLCSHKHSLDLTKMVEKAGKKFVRLRKGTGVNQVAAAICEQAIPKSAD